MQLYSLFIFIFLIYNYKTCINLVFLIHDIVYGFLFFFISILNTDSYNNKVKNQIIRRNNFKS